MIGLSNMDADKDRNMQLLKERAFPVVYSNNRRAIAMEKARPASAPSPMRSRHGSSNPLPGPSRTFGGAARSAM
jgi:hypothetical protein